jgi:hypothetical protein
MYESTMGLIYKSRPDALNWDLKCEQFRPVDVESGETDKQQGEENGKD